MLEFLYIHFAAHFSVHLLLPARRHFLRKRRHFSLRNKACLHFRQPLQAALAFSFSVVALSLSLFGIVGFVLLLALLFKQNDGVSFICIFELDMAGYCIL